MASNDKSIFTDVLTPRAPTQADTSGIISAAQTDAAAKVQATKTNMEVLKDVSDQALGAAKGYLESGLESDIKKTVATYKTSVSYDNAVLQHDLLASGLVEGTPDDLSRAKADIAKYKDAMTQGTMTREQALLAIDKSVKDYSNTMPGYAADFRKLGYELTGIEHLGGYEAFMMLSKQSIAEKLRFDQAKFIQDTNQKMLTDFVNDYKRWPVGGLQGSEMQIYRQQAALKQTAVNLKNQTEVRDQTVAQVEPKTVDYINARLADGILSLNTKLQGIPFSTDPATGKPRPPEDKATLRQRVLADTNTFFETLKSEVLSFNTNQMSNTTREQQLGRIATQQTEMINALKNQDAFDDFKKTMEIRSEKAQDVMNQWSIANPQLVILQKSGLPTPDLAKFWIDSQRDPKRQADFVRTYGQTLDNYYRSISTGGQGMKDYHVNNMSSLSNDPAQLDRLRQTDPGAYAAGLHQVRDGIKAIVTGGWGETPEVQNIQKNSFANWIRGFGNQADPQKADLVEAWTKTVSDPRLAQRIDELPGDQKLNAADAVVQRTRQILENPEFGLLKRLGSLVEEANNNFRGAKYNLVVNPTTKQFELTKTERQLVGKSQSGQTQEVTSPAGNLLGFREVTKTLQAINRSFSAITNVGTVVPEVLPKDLQARGLQQDYLSKLNAGFFNMSYAERASALETTAPNKGAKGKKPSASEQAMASDMRQPDQGEEFGTLVPQMIMKLSDRINDPGFKGLEPKRQKALIDLMNYLKAFPGPNEVPTQNQ